MKRVRVPAPYLPVFCRELYQLVRSGIPLGEGLAMLREDETDPDARSWLDALCRFIEEGMPLAAALRETEAFPAYMTDMVALAEDTGMMNAGAVLAQAGTALAALAAVIAIAALVVTLAPPLRERFAAWFRRSFGGRGVLGQMAVSRFASSMAMAVSSGMSMEESVDLSARLCGGAKEIDEKTGLCRREIEEGGSPAAALAKSGLFSGRDCRLLQLAERTGSLPDTLEDLAARQEEESLRRIDRLVGAIEPAIVVITSALAGVILLSVMLPLMGLLSAM